MSNSTDDVLILGGGVIGLSCALFLLKQGRSVRILEKNRIAAATSSGNCGTITPSHALPLAVPGMIGKALQYMRYADAPFYIKPSTDLTLLDWLLRFSLRCNEKDMRASALAKSTLLNPSRVLMQELIESHAMNCEFTASGLLHVCKTQAGFDELCAPLNLLNECGVESTILNAEQLSHIEPALKSGMQGGVFFPGDAYIKPDAYCAELLRVVLSLGAVVEEQCDITSLNIAANRVESVNTSRGIRSAKHVVLAMGAWSGEFAKSLALKIPIQPGKGYSITYSTPSIRPKTPLILEERRVCVTQFEHGCRLGSTMEFSGFDDSLNQKRLAVLEIGAQEYLREPFGAAMQQQWFGWRPMTYDDLPLIGKSPKHPNLFLATGHGMLGMSMSAITGKLVAELITEQTPSMNMHAYRVDRF